MIKADTLSDSILLDDTKSTVSVFMFEHNSGRISPAFRPQEYTPLPLIYPDTSGVQGYTRDFSAHVLWAPEFLRYLAKQNSDQVWVDLALEGVMRSFDKGSAAEENTSSKTVDTFSSPFHKEIQRMVSRIRDFTKLSQDWDSRGALPISHLNASAAISLLNDLFQEVKKVNGNAPTIWVSPLANGQIEFEWIGFFKEMIFSVAFDDSEKVEVLYVDKTGPEEIEQDLVSHKKDFLQSISSWFLA